MACIYQHIRLDKNEVFYVGIGKTTKRAYSKHSRNKYWKNITEITTYVVVIVKEGLTWEEACQKEKELIAQYGRKDVGMGTLVNMTNGGDGVIGVLKSEELKRRQSDLMKGENNPMYGKKHKRESIAKAVATKAVKGNTGKNKPKTQEHRDKIGRGNKGKKRPDLAMRNRENIGRKFTKSKVATIACPHCNKIGANSNMYRWHFDNCLLLKQTI